MPSITLNNPYSGDYSSFVSGIITTGSFTTGNYYKEIPVGVTRKLPDEYSVFDKCNISTYQTFCPKCSKPHKWQTTGYIPMSFTCEVCSTEYQAKLENV